MILVLLTLILLFGIFLVIKKVENGNGHQNFPPGPWGLPLLGHLAFLGLSPHLKLIKWKKKYGPIIHIRFGSFPTVVLSDSKLIKEAFNMNEFSGRPKIQVYQENNLAKGLVISEGRFNSELRQFTIRKFKEFGIGRKKLEDQIHNGISAFMNFIKVNQGLPVNSEELPSAHILRTLWTIMMTSEPDPQEIEHLNHLVKQILKMDSVLSELANFMPWMEKMARVLSFSHYSLSSNRAKQIQKLQSFTSKLVQEKKRNWEKGQDPGQGQTQEPLDILEMYFAKVAETTDPSSAFHASQECAMNFVWDVFTAGIHTVHTSLTWTLNFMARNPEVQLKLQEEIDLVLGNDLSRLPSLSDQGQMPYTDAVVNEILRKSSVVPLAVPHKATTDVCFHDYTIKKDTLIFANAYEIHHDPKIWGDPENFRPERWFGDSGKKLKTDHFLPFSTGRRICPGDALAREQLFLYVTTLFQKYSVDFHGGRVPKVKGVFGLSLHPSEFTVIFKQRKVQ